MLLSYLIISVLFGFYMILVDNSNLNNIVHIDAFDEQKFRFQLILLVIINFFVLYGEKELIPKINKYIHDKINNNDNNNCNH